MHYGFVGTTEHRKGCGKTYYLVYKAYQAFLSGKEIHSNTHLNFPYIPIHPESFLVENFENCFLLIDEIQNWFNSIGGGFKMILLSAIINQTRKRKNTIGWTAQRLKDVPDRVRSDADIYVCYKYHPDWTRCLDQEDVCQKNHFIVIYEILDDDIWKVRTGLKITCKGVDLYDTSKIIPIHVYSSEQLKKLLIQKQKEGLC